VAVADADGKVVASAGDPGQVAFARSSMKPLQAAVSLSLMRDGEMSEPEVAVACASHNGEEVHVRTVRSLLGRAGLGEGALRTPASLPYDPKAARTVPSPAPVFHNCSGKHAGMLVASARGGFDLGSYREPEHPLQREVLAAVIMASGVEPGAIGVDGCGVPVHALPLGAMATLYARLGRVESLGRLAPFVHRAASAMAAHPYLVAGRDRVCTALMEAEPRVIVKAGAEGLICASVPEAGLGVAVKVSDGSARAADPALLRALALLGLLDDRTPADLERFARPPVLGGGRPVGTLEAGFDLVRA
jgi:L-asparaginase II